MSFKLCANLSYLFTEVPLLDRYDAAARAGFAGVELLAPYDYPPGVLRERLGGAGLRQVLINSFAGDRAAGERGMACIPGREAHFRESIRRTLDYAEALDCKLIHFMAGLKPEGVSQEYVADLYTDNLRWAAEQIGQTDMRFVIEAINSHDMPTYFLQKQEQAAEVIETIGDKRIGMQFDIYHCQTMQGDVARRIERFLPLIAHMQVADVPGRHEPGTGEIGWEFLFKHLKKHRYNGWIGCEYQPLADTVSGLSWIHRFNVE